MRMEFRARITVDGVPYEKPGAWEPLIERLEAVAAEYGPVLTWSDDGRSAVIVMSTEAQTPARAALAFYTTVAETLQALGMAGAYPSSVKVEPADDRQPAAA